MLASAKKLFVSALVSAAPSPHEPAAASLPVPTSRISVMQVPVPPANVAPLPTAKPEAELEKATQQLGRLLGNLRVKQKEIGRTDSALIEKTQEFKDLLSFAKDCPAQIVAVRASGGKHPAMKEFYGDGYSHGYISDAFSILAEADPQFRQELFGIYFVEQGARYFNLETVILNSEHNQGESVEGAMMFLGACTPEGILAVQRQVLLRHDPVILATIENRRAFFAQLQDAKLDPTKRTVEETLIHIASQLTSFQRTQTEVSVLAALQELDGVMGEGALENVKGAIRARSSRHFVQAFSELEAKQATVVFKKALEPFADYAPFQVRTNTALWEALQPTELGGAPQPLLLNNNLGRYGKDKRPLTRYAFAVQLSDPFSPSGLREAAAKHLTGTHPVTPQQYEEILRAVLTSGPDLRPHAIRLAVSCQVSGTSSPRRELENLRVIREIILRHGEGLTSRTVDVLLGRIMDDLSKADKSSVASVYNDIVTAILKKPALRDSAQLLIDQQKVSTDILWGESKTNPDFAYRLICLHAALRRGGLVPGDLKKTILKAREDLLEELKKPDGTKYPQQFYSAVLLLLVERYKDPKNQTFSRDSALFYLEMYFASFAFSPKSYTPLDIRDPLVSEAVANVITRDPALRDPIGNAFVEHADARKLSVLLQHPSNFDKTMIISKMATAIDLNRKDFLKTQVQFEANVQGVLQRKDISFFQKQSFIFTFTINLQDYMGDAVSDNQKFLGDNMSTLTTLPPDARKALQQAVTAQCSYTLAVMNAALKRGDAPVAARAKELREEALKWRRVFEK